MKTNTLQLHSLTYTQSKTYFIATAFAIGNILLPQLAHTVPQGGFIFLPIYFFTLIAAYKYGWQTGLVTALLSPIINHLFFGMPPFAILPILLTKSILLTFTAAYAAHHFKRISIPILTLVVLAYQFIGTLAEWAIIGNLLKALQDFRIGVPGLVIQIVGGYLTINYLLRK